MAERFFPGFKFRRKPIDFIYFQPCKEKLDLSSVGILNINSLIEDEVVEIELVEGIPTSWNPRDLLHEFSEQLEIIGKQIGYQLTLDGRNMCFVTPEEMRPQTEKERRRLLRRYGEYARDGGIADCNRKRNGTFSIRLGFLGKTDDKSKDDVLNTMAHEYGHTLGSRFISPIFEEVKAYTFAALFMKHYGVVEIDLSLEINNKHKTALFRLEQLVGRGICEEAVIAHLISAPFGQFQPDDYFKLLK